MAYFRKLAGQKIINFASGSARTLVDRVIAGEYPIAINIYAHHPLISAAKGAPFDLAADGPGAERRRHRLTDQERHASLRGDAAHRFHAVPGRPEDFRGRRIFPGQSRRAAVAAACRHRTEDAGYAENYVPPQKLAEYVDSTDRILQDLFR